MDTFVASFAGPNTAGTPWNQSSGRPRAQAPDRAVLDGSTRRSIGRGWQQERWSRVRSRRAPGCTRRSEIFRPSAACRPGRSRRIEIGRTRQAYGHQG